MAITGDLNDAETKGDLHDEGDEGKRYVRTA